MDSDDRERFDILFAGECLEGHDRTAVRGAMGRLFRADDATLDRLFGGQRQRIKRGVDRATALKYQKAMQSAGAKAIVQRSNDVPDGTAAGDGAKRAEARPAPAAGATLSLGAVGADLLDPGERSREEVTAPSTEHLSIAEAGHRLSDDASAVAPAVQAPDFQVATAGSDLSDADAAPPPPAPDTSSMALTEGDFDLSDCRAAPPATPDLDLSHLDIAASGTDLLREDERPRREGHVPDTSHLRIEGDDAT